MPSSIRTPRKEKVWTSRTSGAAGGVAITQNAVQVVADLMFDYRTDVGISQVQRFTTMRINGFVQGVEAQSDSTADGLTTVKLGIAWVRSDVAGLSAGNTAIPDPWNPSREIEWIWRGVIMWWTDSSGTETKLPEGETSWLRFESHQMRKQPTVDHRLCLIANTKAVTNVTAQMQYDFDCMFAVA